MRTRAVGAALSFFAVLSLSACSDDAPSTDPVEVEVGKAFTWDGFSVDDGWELNPIERSVNGNTIVTPEVKGSITNDSEEERTALFEMVFSTDGEPVATLNCSAASMVEGQSQQLICPGLSATMPEQYDAVVVQQFDRGDTEPGSSSGSTSG